MYWRMSLAGAAVLAPVLALLAAGPDEKAPKAKSSPPPKVELHRLENADLLKQAGGIYDKAAKDYLASLRGLAAARACSRRPSGGPTRSPTNPSRSSRGSGQGQGRRRGRQGEGDGRAQAVGPGAAAQQP